ncbi:MAG: NAD(P)/FAD-dependent oxidoreductase [Pseudomonadota bacterium]
METTHTLVVGAGQAGIAASEHLTQQGIPHLVLERDRIAERWRSGRWDHLVANGPAWHDSFPGRDFPSDPNGFPGKDEIASYFEDYARMIAAPIRTGIEVTAVTQIAGRPGFRVETSTGVIEAQTVIAATGPFQVPVIPPILPGDAPVHQIHSAAYRNPDELPDGPVLVVGAGASGAQIAEELMTAGRRVYLSVGSHNRPPRRYRGRDFVWWLGVLNKWHADAPPANAKHVTIAVSGANGGRTVDFRRLAQEGMTLVGMTESHRDGVLQFAPDLARHLAEGDANYLSVLDEADAYIQSNGLDLPEEPGAREMLPDPPCVTDPLRQLDLAGIGTVIWATGYRVDYSWLKVDTFDAQGRPLHKRGISHVPGIYFLGLPFLTNRGSSFIWGVWYDAKWIADDITISRGYTRHHAETKVQPEGIP